MAESSDAGDSTEAGTFSLFFALHLKREVGYASRFRVEEGIQESIKMLRIKHTL